MPSNVMPPYMMVGTVSRVRPATNLASRDSCMSKPLPFGAAFLRMKSAVRLVDRLMDDSLWTNDRIRPYASRRFPSPAAPRILGVRKSIIVTHWLYCAWWYSSTRTSLVTLIDLRILGSHARPRSRRTTQEAWASHPDEAA